MVIRITTVKTERRNISHIVAMASGHRNNLIPFAPYKIHLTRLLKPKK
jgi:hypothetical protein